MKKKFLIAVIAVFVLGLTMVVYAFNQSNNSNKTVAAACCCGDSCSMKSKDAKTTDSQAKASCCDKDNCCCKGDSCPMKKQGENASTGCCACCGDSCPMKEKQAQMSMVQTGDASVASSESCQHKKAGI